MKIAVFSDIHGNLEALEAILFDISKRDIDETIFLGDAIGFGPNPKECLETLLKNKVKCVMGNHELYHKGNDPTGIDESRINHMKWVRNKISNDQKEFISKGKLRITKTINNHKFCFEHFLIAREDGYPFHKMNVFDTDAYEEMMKNSEFDYVFFGHIHEPFIKMLDGKVFYDVGSSGCTKDNVTFYHILDISNEVFISKVFLDYDREKFMKKLNEDDDPERDTLSKTYLGAINE